jgi:hypothetical protein
VKIVVKLLLLCLTLSFCEHTFAQAKFTAVASAIQIGVDERVQVEFKAENASIEGIRPPSFRGFVVEGGPFSQTGMTNINGSVSRYYSVAYILRPVRPGRITIDPATAVLNGRPVQSNSLSIQVTTSSTGHNPTTTSPFNLPFDVPDPQPTKQIADYILRKGDNVQDKVANNLFVKLEVDKTSCYVGEPIIATYKLYTRLKSESNLTKTPSFNGFSVVDLEIGNHYELRTERLNGREYSVYILRKVQLYPLQPGLIELDACEVENNIMFLKAEYASNLGILALQDLMLSFAESTMPADAVQKVRTTSASKVIQVDVKPLPEEGKPTSFKGAVGDFKMTAWIVDSTLTTDDAGSLRINIAGSGNIHMVNAPFVKWPTGIEGFEPKGTETLDKTVIPVSGEKQYAYPFTISQAGDYRIEPFEFSFFDPRSGKYKILNSNLLSVSVSKGKGLKRKTMFAPRTDVSSMDVLMLLLYIGTGLAVVIAAAFLIINRKRKAKALNETAQVSNVVAPLEPVIPVSPLIVPQEKLTEGDAPAFFISLNKSMKDFLSKKLQIPLSELNKKRINEGLDKLGVNVHTSQLVCSLLDDIELNLYASPIAAHVQMQEVYEKANEVLGLLEKQGV